MEKEKVARESKAKEASKMEEGEIDEEEELKKKEEQQQKVEGETEAEAARKALARKDSDGDKSRQVPETKIQTEPSNATISSVLDTPIDTQPPLDIETRTTILIPSDYIPTEKPLRPKLWGGGGFDPRPRLLPVRSRRSKNGSANGSKRQRPTSSRGSHLAANKEKTNGSTGPAAISSNSASGNGNSSAELSKPRSAHTRSRRPRRVYTDDSDIFLCAVHSGWLTWSGARKARARGRDLRIEVRVLRCAGAGAGSVFAWGIGKTAATGAVGAGKNATNPSSTGNNAGAGDPPIVKEEVVGRFVGGFGERCFNPLGMIGGVAGEDAYELENMPDLGMEAEDPEMMMAMMYDDPEDDGRSLVSAAWGTGHDGSAIEIVGVEFVERGTAHTACGLGRRNRSQRLLEYQERRAAVLGQSFPSSTHAPAPHLDNLSNRKRRRGWDGFPVIPRRLPNATALDVIREVDEEEDEELMDTKPQLRVSEEEKLMDVRTMVFGMSATGEMRVGYKYVPSLLKEILFPTPRSSDVDKPPPRKRRRIQETEDVEMADGTSASANPNPDLQTGLANERLRPVILETSKEGYLLIPNNDAFRSSASENQGKPRRAYDIALILETEVVLEGDDEPEQEQEKKEQPVPEPEAKTVAAASEDTKPADDNVAKAADTVAADVVPPATAETKEVEAPTSVNPSASADAAPETSAPQEPSTTTDQARPATPPPPVIDPSLMPGSSPLPPPSRASPVHSPVHSPNIDSGGELPPSSPLADRPKTLPSALPAEGEAGTETELETEVEAGSAKVAPLTVQVLQRNLAEEMFRFTEDGLVVLESATSTAASSSSAPAADGGPSPVEAEWVIQVKDWKWAPRGAIVIV
ncbi:hypothetical protein CPC08DRAFT_492123 [Agrocybe pediades]|nr:hypothetical protein CPC08DRAFT_492123 [Agrocybe pediades]